jgi:hypothetical protein
MQSLQQEARAAPAASGDSSSRGWIAMSSNPEELLTQATTSSSQAISNSSSGPPQQAASSSKQGTQAAPSRVGVDSTWVSPAAASMQLLLQMPLDAAAAGGAQTPMQGGAQPEGLDDVLIAAACGADDGATAWQGNPAQQTNEAPLPLLQHAMARMQLASRGPQRWPLSLGTNSGSSSSRTTPAPVHASTGTRAAGTHNHSSSKQPIAGRPCDNAAALQQQGHAVSAAATAAEAAAQAAAKVRPRVASLIQLSSAEIGTGGLLLLGQPKAADSAGDAGSGAFSKGGKLPMGQRNDDTVGAKDAGRLGGSKRQTQQQEKLVLKKLHGSSSSVTQQEAEAELVSTACLALQGVCSAVQQLWGLILQGVLQEGASPTPDRCVARHL